MPWNKAPYNNASASADAVTIRLLQQPEHKGLVGPYAYYMRCDYYVVTPNRACSAQGPARLLRIARYIRA